MVGADWLRFSCRLQLMIFLLENFALVSERTTIGQSSCPPCCSYLFSPFSGRSAAGGGCRVIGLVPCGRPVAYAMVVRPEVHGARCGQERAPLGPVRKNRSIPASRNELISEWPAAECICRASRSSRRRRKCFLGSLGWDRLASLS